MTKEEMEFMVKAATDSYFSNLNENQKSALLSNRQAYIQEYFKVFNLAKKELIIQEEAKLQPFGEDVPYLK